MKKLILAVFFSISLISVTAHPPQSDNLHIIKASTVVLECAAYYSVASIALENSGKNDLAKTFQNNSITLIESSFGILSTISENKSTTEELIERTLNIHVSTLTEKYSEELSSLIDEYAYQCKFLTERLI